MSKAAIMQGVYIDCKFMPGLKSARIAIDIPIEHSNEFLRMFGAPDRANPVHVAVARLEVGAYAPKENGPGHGADCRNHPHAESAEGQDKPRTSFRDMKRAAQAALKLQDETFMAWLVDTYWTGKEEIGDYDGLLKRALGIASKTELDSNPYKGKLWDEMLASFDYRAHA